MDQNTKGPLQFNMAAVDLGLGNMLAQQAQEQADALKKKKQSLAPQAPLLFGAAGGDLLGQKDG